MRLSDRAELDRIIELYMAGNYAPCSEQLSELLDPKSGRHFEDPAIVEQGRLYFASCALLEDRREAARKALRAALEENPLMPSPDSLTFPPPVVSLFLEVRDEVQQLIQESEKEQVVRLRRENELARRRAEQREYRERELEKLARHESVVARNSRFLASVPFGVGQYQNGNDSLGAVFLVSESLLLVTVATSGVILVDLTSKAANGDGALDEIDKYNSQTATAYTTLTWSTWGLIGVAALGVLEAHLSFKPERQLEKRERSLPKELEVPQETSDDEEDFSFRPDVGLLPGGAHIGVSGHF